MTIFKFIRYVFHQLVHGPLAYWLWILLLLSGVVFGIWHYYTQLHHGLAVTNMSDQVAWGLYIANFTFLVGVAAAAVMLAIPAYLFEREDVKVVVLMGDTMAITAVVMAMMFIMVDLGRPDRIWHLIPGVGRFHFPDSMLAWDVVVLMGYVVLNFGISFYIIYSHYQGRHPVLSHYFPLVVVAMFWAISIHTVTAFLYSSNPGRHYWHTALLAPRFIASAFASGPALMIIGFQIIRRVIGYPISQSVISLLAVIVSFALQVTLFFIGAEIFTEFYNEGTHASPFRYLFLGLDGQDALRPWIWTALISLTIAVSILMFRRLRKNIVLLNVACVLTIVGIWIEKGMGLVIPGSVPTPLGEVFEYLPNLTEVSISVGVWSAGLLIFTLLVKAAAPIECGMLENRSCEKNN